MKTEYIELPNGAGIEVIDNILAAELEDLGKLEVISGNYVNQKRTYALFHSIKTGRIYTCDKTEEGEEDAEPYSGPWSYLADAEQDIEEEEAYRERGRWE